LVQALLLGEDQALNVWMDRHREGLFRFVLRHVHNEADALELALETFVRAYFNIGKFRPAAKFATWLYHIALNLCRDHLRSRAHRDSLQTASVDSLTQEAYQGSSHVQALMPNQAGSAATFFFNTANARYAAAIRNICKAASAEPRAPAMSRSGTTANWTI
jgi:RNA polymerase sigma factor (sigma-70 family)